MVEAINAFGEGFIPVFLWGLIFIVFVYFEPETNKLLHFIFDALGVPGGQKTETRSSSMKIGRYLFGILLNVFVFNFGWSLFKTVSGINAIYWSLWGIAFFTTLGYGFGIKMMFKLMPINEEPLPAEDTKAIQEMIEA